MYLLIKKYSAIIKHDIQLKNEISKEFFLDYINAKGNFVEVNENKFIFNLSKYELFILTSFNDRIVIQLCNFNHEYFYDFIFFELIILAEHLNARLYYNKNKPLSHYSLKGVKDRMLKKEMPTDQFSNIFFEQGEWLAIKCDVEQVVEYFDIELIEIKWENYDRGTVRLDGYGDHSIIHHYGGWTFIRDSIDSFLQIESPKNKKQSSYKSKIINYLDRIKDKVIEAGSYFPEIHFYYHVEKYEIREAFFKVKNGKLKYGYCSICEPYFNKSWCRKPKEIKELFAMDARYAAAVWSIYPQELNYYPDFPNTKVWVVRKKNSD